MVKHGRESDADKKKRRKKVESDDDGSDHGSDTNEPGSKKHRTSVYEPPVAKPPTDFAAMYTDLRASRIDWDTVRRAATLPAGLVHITEIKNYDPTDPTNPSKNRVGLRNLRFVKGFTDDNPPKPTISTTFDVVDNNTGRKLRLTTGVHLARVQIGPLGDLDDRYNPYAGGDIGALDSRQLLKNTSYGITFKGIAPGPRLVSRVSEEEVEATDERGREKGWEQVVGGLVKLSRHIARLVLCYTQTPPGDGQKNEFAFPATDMAIQLASNGAPGATYMTMTPDQRDRAVDLLLASKTSKIHYPNPAGLDKPKIVVPKEHGICSRVCTPLQKDASGKPDYKGPHSGEDYSDKGAFMLGIHARWRGRTRATRPGWSRQFRTTRGRARPLAGTWASWTSATARLTWSAWCTTPTRPATSPSRARPHFRSWSGFAARLRSAFTCHLTPSTRTARLP
jgi:hypothetical protein